VAEAIHHATTALMRPSTSPKKWLWTYSNDGPSMGVSGITPAMKLKMAA
jgi:hypothetical protein